MEEKGQMPLFRSIPLGKRSSRVFLEFQYLRVSINTLLCNPNLDIMKAFFPVPVDVGICRTTLNLCIFFCFSQISSLGIVVGITT